ncbi:hypothetical protein TNCV_1701461 [Trichonephila clavipes]|nr:hypothetical protein TNCV_1701461 [Trichonephila clavipes]
MDFFSYDCANKRDQIVSSVRCNRYDVWKPFKSRSTNSLLLHIFDIVAPFDKTCCVVDFSSTGPDKYPQQHLSLGVTLFRLLSHQRIYLLAKS